MNFRVKDIALHFADRCFLIKHFLFNYDKAFFCCLPKITWAVKIGSYT